MMFWLIVPLGSQFAQTEFAFTVKAQYKNNCDFRMGVVLACFLEHMFGTKVSAADLYDLARDRPTWQSFEEAYNQLAESF